MNNKKIKEQKEDIQSNRMAFFLILTFAAVMLMMYLYRRIESVVGLQNYETTMWALCGVAAAVGLWGIVRLAKAKGKDTKLMLVSPVTQVLLSVFAMVLIVIIRFYYIEAIKFLYFLLPALCVLYIILVIYGNEFFAVSFFLLTSAGALFIYYRAGSSSRLAPYLNVLAGILLAYGLAFMLFTVWVQKNKGNIKLFGKQWVVVKENGRYITFYGAALAEIGIAIAYFITPINAAYYGFFILGGMLALCAAYYTYKLMYNE